MKMKYFRFLYGETKSCMIHLGEVNDTRSNETITFLFFRGSEAQADQTEQDKRCPFLWPASVDLAVLGNVNLSVKQIWNEIQQQVKVRTLLIPDVMEAEDLHLEHVDEVIRLQPFDEDVNSPEMSSEKMVGMNQWNAVKAGWNLQIMCWKEGALAFWHDLYTEKKEMKEFTDCVMSVKAVEGSVCCENRKPDEYGCAVGCVLHRDYDVCKFRYANRANPYLTGTFLAAGAGDEKKERELRNWLSEKTDGIRFFSMQNLEETVDVLMEKERTEPGMRRYVVGMSGEVKDQTVADLCRNGFGSTPVILTEGKGICCSGLFNYTEV